MLFMWVIYPEIPLTCVYVCGWWHPCTAFMCLRVWIDHDVTYSLFHKDLTVRKRSIQGEAWMCISWVGLLCSVWTEWLCGQKNNADQFAVLSYGVTFSNKEAKSAETASPTTSNAQQIIGMVVRKGLCKCEHGCQESCITNIKNPVLIRPSSCFIFLLKS